MTPEEIIAKATEWVQNNSFEVRSYTPGLGYVAFAESAKASELLAILKGHG